MGKKLKILLIYTDTIGGIGFYRSIQPHEALVKMYPDEFEVYATIKPNFDNLSNYNEFDIIHFHKGVFTDKPEEQEKFTNALKYFKKKGIVTVMDIDDHWKLGSRHPLYRINVQARRNGERCVDNELAVKINLELSDYVTTTTDIFAGIIRPFNKNVFVFPNSIDPDDERFKISKKRSNKLRIGFIMGSTHECDMETMGNFVGKLPKDILDKIEIVLCGFDNRGTITEYMPDGTTNVRPIRPEEGVWYRYEKMVTDDYRIVSKGYKDFLTKFMPNSEYPYADEEGYKRCWTKDINHYYQHYKEIDVLFAPLKENEFNKVKSELKPIECCFSHTAFVGSNFGPYTIGLKNLFKKGGEIDSEGNAILIDEKRGHKDWTKTIERLVKHPEYVKLLQDNLYRDFHEKYDLKNVTRMRADFYKKITEEKGKH